jgi:hypothetical protein
MLGCEGRRMNVTEVMIEVWMRECHAQHHLWLEKPKNAFDKTTNQTTLQIWNQPITNFEK